MKNKKETKIFTNEEDLKFPDDPTDVEYLNNSVDSESSDEKFIEYLKTMKSFDLPKSMMGNVQRNLINSYRKDYRHIILWRKIKIKTQDLKDFIYEHLPGKLELAFATVAILSLTIGVYRFVSKNSEKADDQISQNTNPYDTRAVPREIKEKGLNQIDSVSVHFSDEKAGFLKEKIFSELKKSQLKIIDNKEKPDAMLFITNDSKLIQMELTNIEGTTLWSKSVSANQGDSPLLEELFLKIQKEKSRHRAHTWHLFDYAIITTFFLSMTFLGISIFRRAKA